MSRKETIHSITENALEKSSKFVCWRLPQSVVDPEHLGLFHIKVAKEAEKDGKVKEMPGEEKEMVQKVEKEDKRKESKASEIEEKEEGEMFKSEEDERSEERV